MLSDHRRRGLRSTFAVLATAMALVAGLHVAADAARAVKPLLLGANNKAHKTTKLTSKKGPALSLKAKRGPALEVNSSDVVKNLNADLLDGQSVETISPVVQSFSIGVAGIHGTGTQQYFQTTTLPGGQYEMQMSGALSGAPGSSFCELFDGTKIEANPADISAIYLLDSTTGDAAESLTDRNIAPVVAGHRLVFTCLIDAGALYAHPILFTLRRLDDVRPVRGVAPTTFSRSTGRALAGAAR